MDDGRQAAAGAEDGGGQPSVSKDDRILAVSPNYVIEWVAGNLTGCNFNILIIFKFRT